MNFDILEFNFVIARVILAYICWVDDNHRGVDWWRACNVIDLATSHIASGLMVVVLCRHLRTSSLVLDLHACFPGLCALISHLELAVLHEFEFS